MNPAGKAVIERFPRFLDCRTLPQIDPVDFSAVVSGHTHDDFRAAGCDFAPFFGFAAGAAGAAAAELDCDSSAAFSPAALLFLPARLLRLLGFSEESTRVSP